MVNTNSFLRQLLDIEIGIGYQKIIGNLHLLDNVTLLKISDVFVISRHHQILKKKRLQPFIICKNRWF
jgi:hypothetical protein